MSDKQRRVDLWKEFKKLLPSLVREFELESIDNAVAAAFDDYLHSMENKENEQYN